MDVINVNAKRVTNYEVLKLLKDLKEKKQQKGQGQLATIAYETTKYLETHTQCSRQTAEKIIKCNEELKELGLKLNERQTILNIQPTTALEIQLIVDSSEERLTEEQVEKIIKLSLQVKDEPEEESAS